MADQIDFEKALFGEEPTRSDEGLSLSRPGPSEVKPETKAEAENYDDNCAWYEAGGDCRKKEHKHTPRK